MSVPLPSGFRAWLAGARIRTLPAAIVPVAVGSAVARGVDGPIVAWRGIAAAVVALALQVATNFANDYSDGIRGTDDPGARVGPVRLVGWGIKPPEQVKTAALASFAVAGVFGLALALAVGPELIVVGALAMAAGWFYTGGSKPYGYYGFGELFVFVFFGVVATVGSTYVQTETIPAMSLLASVPVGLLSTALLVTNNLRDIPGDTIAGKKTLAVRLGDRRTRLLFQAMIAGVFVLIAAAGIGRSGALFALAAIPLAISPVQAVHRGARGPALIPVLQATARLQLVAGLLLAAGIAFTPADGDSPACEPGSTLCLGGR